MAYRGIQERNQPHFRATTSVNIQSAREAINAHCETMETDESIWYRIYNPAIRIKIRQFLFKSMHGTQKIGDFWTHVRGYEERATCNTCQCTESMEHILTTCQEPARGIIWNLAENLWPHEDKPWPVINLGTILGCGSLQTHLDNDQANQAGNGTPHRSHTGETRLLKILVSESAYLIWTLRCERVIQVKRLNENEIIAKWHYAINKRLTDDKLIATQIKRSEYAIRQVKNTWEDALRKQREIPNTWVHHDEVLVGRR